MILHPRSDEEYLETLAMLRIINTLRRHGPEYFPPVMTDTPWIRTCWARPEYL